MPSLDPHEILALSDRLDASIRQHAELRRQRGALIQSFRATGLRADPRQFAELCDAITAAASRVAGLRATLEALGQPRVTA